MKLDNPYRKGSVRNFMFTALTINADLRDDKIQAYLTSVNMEYVYKELNQNGNYEITTLNNVVLERILRAEKDGIISPRSTHEREWRYIQNKHPELRGKDWAKRQKQCKEKAEYYAEEQKKIGILAGIFKK